MNLRRLITCPWVRIEPYHIIEYEQRCALQQNFPPMSLVGPKPDSLFRARSSACVVCRHGEQYRGAGHGLPRVGSAATRDYNRAISWAGLFAGEPGGTRTHDPVIKSHVLYRLSYGLLQWTPRSGNGAILSRGRVCRRRSRRGQ
jgi:hypothetical protein